MTNSTMTKTVRDFDTNSPVGELAAIFEPAGYEYRPVMLGTRMVKRAWRNDAGTTIKVESWCGYAAHFILSVENQGAGYYGDGWSCMDDDGGYGEGARKALALARRFSTLATR